MSIFLDDRETGLLAELQRLDLSVVTTRLKFGGQDAGDAMWSGNWVNADGKPETVMVGVERKRLSDLIACMKDRRLAGLQLRRMWLTYDVVHLCIEGVWRPGPNGEIEELGYRGWQPFFGRSDRRSVAYAHVTAFLQSLTMLSRSKAGEPLRVFRTSNPHETAAAYAALFNWYQKPFTAHHALDSIYTEFTLPKKGHGGGWAHPHSHDATFDPGKRALVWKDGTEDPCTLWRMAAQLPGVDRRARAVAEHFGTVREMANATEKEWMRVPGVGKKVAAAAVRAITEPGE